MLGFWFWFIVWAMSNKQCLRKLVNVYVCVYSYFIFPFEFVCLFVIFCHCNKYECGLRVYVYYAVGNNAYSNGSGEKCRKLFGITNTFTPAFTYRQTIIHALAAQRAETKSLTLEYGKMTEFECSYACEKNLKLKKGAWWSCVHSPHCTGWTKRMW